MTQSLERLSPQTNTGEILQFNLGDRQRENSTTYNPSVPFVNEGRKAILLRHESASSEADSEAVVADLETKLILPEAPVFKQMQDPYYLGVLKDSNGEDYHVIGGVRITVEDDGSISSWRDECFRYKESIYELNEDSKPFLTGVFKWKDTRFAQTDTDIAVFPRPQGEFGGTGQVGFFRTANLDTLQADLQAYADKADESTLIKGLLKDGEWGGMNQIIPLSDGTFWFVGHRAYRKFKDNPAIRTYEVISGYYEPRTNEVSEVQTVVEGKDFGQNPVKDPETMEENGIVFAAGVDLTSRKHNVADNYVGLGDMQVARRLMKLPPSILSSSFN